MIPRPAFITMKFAIVLLLCPLVSTAGLYSFTQQFKQDRLNNAKGISDELRLGVASLSDYEIECNAKLVQLVAPFWGINFANEEVYLPMDTSGTIFKLYLLAAVETGRGVDVFVPLSFANDIELLQVFIEFCQERHLEVGILNKRLAKFSPLLNLFEIANLKQRAHSEQLTDAYQYLQFCDNNHFNHFILFILRNQLTAKVTDLDFYHLVYAAMKHPEVSNLIPLPPQPDICALFPSRNLENYPLAYLQHVVRFYGLSNLITKLEQYPAQFISRLASMPDLL